jgi:hypothetical protein
MTRGERATPGIARQETSLHDRLAQVSLTGELEDGRSAKWKTGTNREEYQISCAG